MVISHVSLINWKNFRDVQANFGKRVFLIGPNASGKSNFLDVFRFLRDIVEDGLDKAVAARGGMKAIRFYAARAPMTDVGITVTLDDTWTYELVLTHRALPQGKQIPCVVKEIVTQNGRKLLDRPDEHDNEDKQRLTQTALEQVNANKDFREVADFFRNIVYRHILPQVVRDPKGFSSGPVSDDPYGRDIVFQIWNTPSNTREARLKRLNKVLGMAVPNLENLKVEMRPHSGQPHLLAQYKNWRPHGTYQDETSFSDGTLRLLALLWAVLEPGGTLLLEEPELSLHEEIVAALPGLFAQLSKGKKSRQVLISTHSRAMLEDQGIGPGEVLWLYPTNNGTELREPDEQDRLLMQNGLSVADTVLPKTRPAEAGKMIQLKL